MDGHENKGRRRSNLDTDNRGSNLFGTNIEEDVYAHNRKSANWGANINHQFAEIKLNNQKNSHVNIENR